MSDNKSIEDLESTHALLTEKRESVQNSMNRVMASRDERKRLLKEAIEECRKAGFNPDTLPADIQHLKQVLITKMDIISAELVAAENILRPMLREIEKG